MLFGGIVVQILIYLSDNNGDFSESAAMSAFGESGFWDFEDQYWIYSTYFTLFWNVVLISFACLWLVVSRTCRLTCKQVQAAMCEDV